MWTDPRLEYDREFYRCLEVFRESPNNQENIKRLIELESKIYQVDDEIIFKYQKEMLKYHPIFRYAHEVASVLESRRDQDWIRYANLAISLNPCGGQAGKWYAKWAKKGGWDNHIHDDFIKKSIEDAINIIESLSFYEINQGHAINKFDIRVSWHLSNFLELGRSNREYEKLFFKTTEIILTAPHLKKTALVLLHNLKDQIYTFREDKGEQVRDLEQIIYLFRKLGFKENRDEAQHIKRNYKFDLANVFLMLSNAYSDFGLVSMQKEASAAYENLR